MWFKNWNSDNIKHLIKVKKLYHKRSKIQTIDLYESRYYGKILALDNEIQYASRFTSYTHESLTHPALLQFGCPKTVLIVGGGDGGCLQEVTKYDCIERIDLVEIDKEVIATCKRFLTGTKKAFSDSRVNVYLCDAADFVATCKSRYDVIIMDVSDPKNAASKLFSYDFLKKLKLLMNKRAAIITHCESPDSTVGNLYYRIIATFKTVFNIVRPFRVWMPHYIDFWGRLIASDYLDPCLLTKTEIKRVINKHKLDLKWLNARLYRGMFDMFSNDILVKLNSKNKIITNKSKITFRRP